MLAASPPSRVSQFVAAILVVACAWFATSEMVRVSNEGVAADPYRVAEADARFGALRPFLKNERIVGWMASRAVGASEADEAAHSQARYAIVPTLLAGDADRDVVVACFDTDAELDAVIAKVAYEVLGRPSPGLAVLKRRAR